MKKRIQKKLTKGIMRQKGNNYLFCWQLHFVPKVYLYGFNITEKKKEPILYSESQGTGKRLSFFWLNKDRTYVSSSYFIKKKDRDAYATKIKKLNASKLDKNK